MIKLRFGKNGNAEALPAGRLVTSFEGPKQVPAEPTLPALPAQPDQPALPAEADGLDALASLVIERLSRSPLPESLARIVTEVSERLVREEIARIRDRSRTVPPADGRGST